MCGRFVDPYLHRNLPELSVVKINPYPQRFNVKPTQDVLVFLGDGEARYARWWLIPSWHKGEAREWKAATFNARIETAATAASFRGAWKRGRCLIPVSGYYEWTGEKGCKQPHYIVDGSGCSTLWFAGLMSPSRDGLSCAILTRSANNTSAAVHTRMPVCLSADERTAWMAGTDDLQIGADFEVRHYPVSPFAPNDDGVALIEPLVL